MNPKPQYTLTKFSDDAIKSVYKGVDLVAEAVSTTLGPLGKNFLIEKSYKHKIIHDGVEVSLVFNPEDEFERAGAQLMKEATMKQRDEVGDGTTAVCVLTKAILDETLKVTSSGVNPMLVRKGLESGAEKVVSKLKSLSKPVKTLDQKIQIATISSQSSELGKLVAETIHKIGDEGVFTVEDSKATDTFVEHQEGMQIDKGLTSEWFVTDPERGLAVAEDIHILVTDYPLNTVHEIGSFLDSVVFKNTKKVLFISPEIGDDFMRVMVGAKLQGQFLGLCMRAPGIGGNQIEQLQDLCALTGATLITKEGGMKFAEQTFEVLGQAHKVVQSKLSTIITGGAGHRKDILARIASIKGKLKDGTISDYDREQLKGRYAKLTNGVAVIKVGGQTEVERDERKERVIDAVQSTQSACKHGLVAGGEVVYLSCLLELDETILGEKILKGAITAPFKRLVSNAGLDSGAMLSEAIKRPYIEGLDVTDGEFKDMIKAGIIDPVSVPVQAIRTAVSVATQLSSLGGGTVLKNEAKVS